VTTDSWLRPDLAALPPYVPGKRVESGAASWTARLASNESPFAPLDAVVEALADELRGVNRYPDMSNARVADAVGDHVGVEPSWVAVGNGSSSLIRDIVATVAGPGDEVLFASPSFPYYSNATVIAGATPVGIPLDSAFRHDLDAFVDAVTVRTRLIFVCNPNNPTGTTVSFDEIAAFIERVPTDVLIVLDEAYIEFATSTSSALPLVRKHENVVVLRTFSKAYGLAGLRIGYLVGPPAVATAVTRVAVPFTVNAIAQVAAVASLSSSAQEELRQRVSGLVRERMALVAAVEELGLGIPASEANFIYLPIGPASAEFVAFAEQHGVLVRATGGGVRATVGRVADRHLLVRVIREWDALGRDTGERGGS
jgi:histidinol-phosphate aminotransferase